MIIEHVYAPIGTVECRDFTLYCDAETYWRSNSNEKFAFVCDHKTHNKLESLDSYVSVGISPAKGSSVYVAPPCPIAIEDIRKNYQIKRGADNGDYNVYSPLKANPDICTFDSVVVFPSRKIIVAKWAGNVGRRAMFQYAQSRVPEGLDISEMIYDIDIRFYGYAKRHAAYKHLLDGDLKKPIVSISQLDLNSENEVTLDLLRLVYETGRKDWREQDAEKNYAMQLTVLNQHNWREYAGTVAMILSELTSRGVGYSVLSRPSGYSKAIQPMLDRPYGKDFVSQKDMDMARAFLNSLLDIGDCRYTTVHDLQYKINDINLSIATFNKLYNNIVKLTPKTYEAKQS